MAYSADWLAPASGDANLRKVLPTVFSEMPALEVGVTRQFSSSEKVYFSFYELDPQGVAHDFGAIEHAGKQIAVHVYRPSEPRGTVVVVHGYLDHSGGLSPIVLALVADRFNVVAYDQPGHGLSEGAVASIDDFREYGDLFADIVRRCRDEWGLEEPLHVVSHSMGSSAVVDVLLRNEPVEFDEVILITPLVRSAHWHLTGLGVNLASPFRKRVPRVFRKKAGSKPYSAFLRNDPLQARVVPFKWLRANRRWYRRMKKAGTSTKPVLILQGLEDDVVDHRYNVACLTERFPNAVVVNYRHCGHRPMNERTEIRDRFLQDLRNAVTSR